MIPQAVPCRHAATAAATAITSTALSKHTGRYTLQNINRLISSPGTRTQHVPGQCTCRRAATRLAANSRSRDRQAVGVLDKNEDEAQIWRLLRFGNIHQAVALGNSLYSNRGDVSGKAGLSAIAPLTQFMLIKRKLDAECLRAGIYALEQENGSITETEPFVHVVLAALVADSDSALPDLYKNLSDDQQRLANTLFSASTYFYHISHRRSGSQRYHIHSHRLDARIRSLVHWAYEHRDQLSGFTESLFGAQVLACWSLRRPTPAFTDVRTAGTAIHGLLQRRVVPDCQALCALISSAVRTQQASVVLPIYASQAYPQRIPPDVLIRLVSVRDSLGKAYPRLHFDVLGSLIRANNGIHHPMLVAVGLQDQLTFHFVLKQWAKYHPEDWRSIQALVNAMLQSTTSKILHSTHHLAIVSMLGAFRHLKGSAPNASAVLLAGLRIHRKLLPRLESQSLPAMHQLIRALTASEYSNLAYNMYRAAARQLSPLATEPLVAALAEYFARREDMRSIMHLVSMVTRQDVRVSLHFYSAVITGLLSTRTPSRGRLTMAEAMLKSMRWNQIRIPPKVLHSLMHGWADIGRVKRAVNYFNQISKHGGASYSMASWGMLMLAYMRAGDTPSVMSVLLRAQRNMADSLKQPQTAMQADRTSPLINMAMSALINNGSSWSALYLFDQYLDKQSTTGLPVVPSDPITLGLIIHALLSNHKLQEAAHIFDSMHQNYDIPESPLPLRPLVKYCLRYSDVDACMNLARRFLLVGGTLADKEWLYLMQMCYDNQKTDDFAFLYEQVCKKKKEKNLLSKYPEIAEWIQWLSEEKAQQTPRVPEKNKSDKLGHSPEKQLDKYDEVKISNGIDVSSHHHTTLAEKKKLYRQLLRTARSFAIPELRGKLKRNIRFCFELYQDVEASDPRIENLVSNGWSQNQWLKSWLDYPDLALQVTR